MSVNEWAVLAAVLLSGIAAIFAFLSFIRAGRAPTDRYVTYEQVSQLLRDEADRIRSTADEQARSTRQEVGENIRGFQDTTLKVFNALGDRLGEQIVEFGRRLDAGIKSIDERAKSIGEKIGLDIAKMGEEANQNREALRQLIEAKLDDAATKQAATAKELREEMTTSFRQLGAGVSETLTNLGLQQKERLEQVATALGAFGEKQEKAQEALRQTVEGRLDAIRTQNEIKLDEMRKTVDEKLQATLETRLGESFNRVVEQLERVYKGIGEMQSLAANVGDLKRVLSNVRSRGTFGEMEVGILLEQFLSPEQVIKNAQIKDGSQERVEYAIRLPGRGSGEEVLLPIDAKFPQDDYERLVSAAENGDAEGVAESGKALEARIRLAAKEIRDKYISVPKTTDFAILFLPTESLYAEVLRRPGFFDQLQREHHVTLAGPTTFTALLNALQMGFRSLAIEKRSSEVWQVLGAVRGEFKKYGEVVDALAKQLSTAAKSVNKLGVRTRAMDRKLRDVEQLPDETAKVVLGSEIIAVIPESDDETETDATGEELDSK